MRTLKEYKPKIPVKSDILTPSIFDLKSNARGNAPESNMETSNVQSSPGTGAAEQYKQLLPELTVLGDMELDLSPNLLADLVDISHSNWSSSLTDCLSDDLGVGVDVRQSEDSNFLEECDKIFCTMNQSRQTSIETYNQLEYIFEDTNNNIAEINDIKGNVSGEFFGNKDPIIPSVQLEPSDIVKIELSSLIKLEAGIRKLKLSSEHTIVFVALTNLEHTKHPLVLIKNDKGEYNAFNCFMDEDIPMDPALIGFVRFPLINLKGTQNIGEYVYVLDPSM